MSSDTVDGDVIGGVPRRRIVIASMVGTTIEFYDFYIYATAAVSVFPHLFFPKGDSTTALLASLATFGLAFVARPVGSILFGHFGDRVGRKATLVASLLVMGIATFVIGLLPTYHQVGVIAPALLAIMRFSQGLALGGEWSGAALLATETAQPGKRGWAAMWPQLGAPIGFLLANGLFVGLLLWHGHSNLKPDLDGAFLTWAWRIPFLLSAVMVAIGLYVRLRLIETPVFTRAVERGEKVKTPLTEVFRTSWRQLIIGTFVMLATYTIFYIVTTWALSFGTGKRPPDGGGLGFGYVDFLQLQLIAVLFFAATLPLSGLISDRFGRRRSLLVVTIGIMAYGGLFAPMLGSGDTSKGTMLLFLIIGMTLMGFTFGPMSAVLPELFPTNVRYTGSGISYNVASILGAAVAPFIATWLATSYGVGWVGLYLFVAATLSLIAILIMHETKDASLDSVAEPDPNTVITP
ncbi:MFS transporter [Mycolicibacterium moriokaense]|uniref:Putative proline/betaine transporter n=1 Tax=Mycolicibacterium moriokaense TaxID=39691 RepID=A0AAD1HGA3_9MYCO|nr:MFS transporter [Mycolicibacterium moriokaense]MCV7038857.1 MHS family MFS transporter [Mycolicibacterium moriokaense]ORB25449.1 MFS transporter [Mycolicibacterium moriokaense]BBX03533.1 MFS transporter [Mycolicibacterium moriokaense]